MQRRVAMFVDISQRREAEEADCEHQANFDALTDLPNRKMFRDRLDQDDQKRPRGSRPLALMLLDLDRLQRGQRYSAPRQGRDVCLKRGGRCV